MAEYTPTPEAVEAAARALAELRPGEDWPTNEALGGGPTGTRDDEYRAVLEEDARRALVAAGPLIAAEALREAAPGCNCEDDYARLNDRADRIEKEADRG